MIYFNDIIKPNHMVDLLTPYSQPCNELHLAIFTKRPKRMLCTVDLSLVKGTYLYPLDYIYFFTSTGFTIVEGARSALTTTIDCY